MKKMSALFLLFGIIIVFISCKNSGKNAEELPDIISDEMITQAVIRELKHYPEVPSNKIEVASLDDIVTLTGDVNNLLASEKAEEIVSIVRGVEGVINQLRVKSEEVSDENLKKNIEAMFYHDPVVERYEIDVFTDNGHVLLAGIVDSWGEKQLAEDIAKYVKGVVSVENQIRISYKENRSNDEIKADIAGLMQFDVHIDYDFIDVIVNNNIVTLSGTVGSLFEKSKAESLAWVIGVDSVRSDNLKIEIKRKDVMRKNTYNIEKTDEEIQKAVQKTLVHDARVDIVDVEIQVKDGYVSLDGSVNNLRAKKAAEDDADNVLGVVGVENRLKIEPLLPKPPKTVQDNTEVALSLHPYLSLYSIKVEEDNGILTLNGNVVSDFERQLAEDIVSAVPGVIWVENNLELIPVSHPKDYATSTTIIKEPDLPPDSVIKKGVENELWWSPFVNENQVIVTVENGNVTLNGTVNTRYEKEQAEENALEGGAFTVENNLLVDFWQ